MDLLTNLTMNYDLSVPFYRLPNRASWQIGNAFYDTQHARFSTQI